MKTQTALLAAATAFGLTATAVAMPAPDPAPSPAQGHVDVNAGHHLTVRAQPSSTAARLRRLGDGAGVRITCQTTGSTVTGTFGTSNLWDHLQKGGYVSDTFVYTGSDGRVAPDCGGTTPAPTPTPAPASGTPASVTLHDDYKFSNGNPDHVDDWGFYQRECTSFVASRLNKVMSFSNRMRGGHFGNAENWDDNARALGYTVNRTPKVGSVLVRNSGSAGHVAIVAKVGDGRVYVEQYNADGNHHYSQGWLTIASYMDFIHFVPGQ